jgi:hypothetical protein
MPKPEINLEAEECAIFLHDLHLAINLIVYLTRDKSCKKMFYIGCLAREFSKYVGNVNIVH